MTEANLSTDTVPSISEWFRKRNVLVTGATGFMGKVLLSKLLSSCPEIGQIFILVREKKGVDPGSRLTSIIQISQLQAFIHVSTAYCQCGQAILEEKAYSTPIPPETVLSTVEHLDDDMLELMTPKLLGDQPNTYAFSKALSEDLVARSGLPIGVARPSIVVASWKEPAPGWVENMNGPTGLMIGAGKGVIRSMLCNKDYLSDFIPCDLAVNAIIALAWSVGLEQPSEPFFMNVTESGENPISWGCALETGRKHALTYPFSGPLWYPGGRLTSSKIIHWFVIIFLHTIPAYLLDALFIITGNKPFLVKIQSRISSGLELLQYYTTKEWIFRNDRLKDMQQRLRSSDREIFFMNTKDICWDDYILNYILGTRKYCLKDDPSTLPQARRVFAYLYVADLFVRIAFGILIAWLVYSWIIPFKATSSTFVEVNEI
ncbi:fatty acyl-CoA reductase 1 isoform X2 [Cephus cinctus]|uniref:Fatty acyl-CoA reductase n=1 Tax=Cephus cinctus TaxID=211228 RepID=A0AAJ7W4T0_CEPCN|nr:fatty acyl-CoA reductase 1 isoform X2 [Cephus cinctus]